MDIADAYPHYKAESLAHRMRSRQLQAAAFEVTPATLDAYTAAQVICDRDVLHRWARSGRGAIFASPHYGPFLGSALLFASLGTEASPSHVFYDPAESVPDNGRFDLFFKRFEGRLNVLHNQANDLIKAGRALRSKQCISIMFDVVQRAVDCVYVPFFGRLYPAMGGCAYLSLLFKAPIVPVYTVPDAERKVRVIFGEPILPENYMSSDRDQDVFAMTCALFRDLERQLIHAPWHWIYWGNVSYTTRFSDDMVCSERAMMEEIRRRVDTTPALVKVAPVLESLAQAL
jgi:KDO2-lipid IV(A) lauroyltransferase